MNGARRTLADAVEAALRDTNRSRFDLSGITGIPLSTLQGWMDNNRFSRQRWSVVAEALQLPEDPAEIEREYQVEWKNSKGRLGRPAPDVDETGAAPLTDRFDQISSDRQHRIDELLHDAYERQDDYTVELYSALSHNSLLAFVSIEPAIEFSWARAEKVRLFDQLVKAVSKGASFVYLRPSDRLLGSIGDLWPPGREYSEDVFRKEFEDFQVAIQSRLIEFELTGATEREASGAGPHPARKHASSDAARTFEAATADAEGRVNSHVMQYFYDIPLFIAPGYTWAVFRLDTGEKLMTTRIPEPPPAILPMSGKANSFTVTFDQFVLRVLLEQFKGQTAGRKGEHATPPDAPPDRLKARARSAEVASRKTGPANRSANSEHLGRLLRKFWPVQCSKLTIQQGL